MEMATRLRAWTRADLARLPDDGNRYEVLNGKLLVTPQASVPHQDIAGQLAGVLRAYCGLHGIGRVFGPGAVPFGENEVQPDVEVVPDIVPPLPEKWEALPLPILVVEILSGSTRRRDRGEKRMAYAGLGIAEYWIVDRRAREVTVVRPGSEDQHVTRTLRWQPHANLPPLEISLAELFV
jgi:Uma2 family endonuclease